MEEVSLMEVRALPLGIAGRMYKPLLSGIIFFFSLRRILKVSNIIGLEKEKNNIRTYLALIISYSS